MLSAKDIARAQFSSDFDMTHAIYDNIVEVVKGKSILKYDDVIDGRVMVAGFRSTTFIDLVDLGRDDILIVGDRHSIIEYAIESKARLIVITGNHKVKKEHLELARRNKVNIISTGLDTLPTAKIFNLANKVSTIIRDKEVLCINESEDLNEFIKVANRTRYSYYPVLGKDDKCLGILRFILHTS